MGEDLKLPVKPADTVWDITVASCTVFVRLKAKYDQKVVADGGRAVFGANESETFIAATVVSLAQKAVEDYERAESLTKRFGVTVRSY
ncbi:Uncharacterised protein [Mycobacteroides abscessus subsp. abscessus]|nr:Uncharacterised protein [Mycobacteroides abscessus subsp. abscessus]